MKKKILKIIAVALVVACAVGIFFTVQRITSKHQIVSIHKEITRETGEKEVIIDDPEFDDYLDDILEDINLGNDASDITSDEFPEDEDFIEDDLVIPDVIPMEVSKTKNPKKGNEVDKEDVTRNIDISLRNVAYEDFMSSGGNTFSELTADGALRGGFDSVQWELNKYFFGKLKMGYTRMLFNMDCLITDSYNGTNPHVTGEVANIEDNIDYQKYTGRWIDPEDGETKYVYTFDNDKMDSYWRMCDALNEAGTELWLCTGWKVVERISSWYGFSSNDPLNAAPYDLKAFVRANVALLAETEYRYPGLIQYVGYGNEPQEGLDFANTGDVARYNAILCILTREALNYYDKDHPYIIGTANDEEVPITLNHIKVSGSEDNSLSLYNDTYLKKMLSYASNSFDVYAGHIYYSKGNNGVMQHNYESLFQWYGNLRELTNDRFFVGETYMVAAEDSDKIAEGFDTYKYASGTSPFTSKQDYDFWDVSSASYYIMAANTGTRGINTWSVGPQYWPKYQNLINPGADEDFLGFYMYEVKDELRTTSNYYTMALIQNYIEAHSDVLTVNWDGEDIRVAAFRMPDGEYTFLVEANESQLNERKLNIQFDNSLGKTLYRIGYAEGDRTNQPTNTLIPTPDKEFESVGNVIEDTIDGSYSVYIYTTKKPISQLETPRMVYVEAGNTVEIDLDYHACEGDVKWEIVASTPATAVQTYGTGFAAETGSVKDGVYTASENAQNGDRILVKATLMDGDEETSTYSVTMVRIGQEGGDD